MRTAAAAIALSVVVGWCIGAGLAVYAMGLADGIEAAW